MVIRSPLKLGVAVRILGAIFVIIASFWITLVLLDRWDMWPLPLGSAPTAPPTPSAATAPAKSGFDTWSFVGLTGQANAATAPDGTNTAYKLMENNETTSHAMTAVVNFDPLKPIGASVYSRDGNGRRLMLYLAHGQNQVRCDVDLASGRTQLKATGAAIPSSCKTTAQKDGWWRIETAGITGSAGSAAPPIVGITPTKEPFGELYAGSGGHVFIWNAEVSQSPPPELGLRR